MHQIIRRLILVRAGVFAAVADQLVGRCIVDAHARIREARLAAVGAGTAQNLDGRARFAQVQRILVRFDCDRRIEALTIAVPITTAVTITFAQIVRHFCIGFRLIVIRIVRICVGIFELGLGRANRLRPYYVIGDLVGNEFVGDLTAITTIVTIFRIIIG